MTRIEYTKSITKLAVMAMLSQAFYSTCLADEPLPGHFRFSGVMSQITAKDVAIAPVTQGLPFTISLSDNGAAIAPLQFDLKVNDWAKPIRLTLKNVQFANGRLTTLAQLQNSSGAAIEGVRLDIVGATEEFKAKDEKGEYLKDDKGNPVIKTRAQRAGIGSPLFFGDLAQTDVSDALALEMNGLSFTPDTERINLNGVVSGLRFVNDFSIGDLTCYEIDTDARGRLYVAGGSQVVRFDADGQNLTSIIKATPDNADDTKGLPDCRGVVINRKTGDIFVNGGNNRIVQFSSTGREIGRIQADKERNGIDWLTLGLRLDSRGRLYNCGDNNRVVQCIANGKQLWAASVDDGALFDVDATQNTYACVLNEVWQIDSGGKIVNKHFIVGPDWHPGHVYNTQSARFDANGNLYIIEGYRGPSETGAPENRSEESARISVFTGDGRFVRVWGRGGKASIPDEYLPGQVYNPVDLVFGPNGYCYVVCPAAGAATHILAFQPF